MQTNSRRVSHDLERSPNTFRDDQLRRILDDIDEEISGAGYSEVIRVGGPFVTKIITWDRPTNNPSPDPEAKKRTETNFSRTGAFVDSIIKDFYNDEGTAVIATTTITFTRDVNQRILVADVVNTRV